MSHVISHGSHNLNLMPTSGSSTYAIHTWYDMKSIPPKLSRTSIRFICISDNHGGTFPVPDGDVLLHAGDFTELGQLDEMERVMNWIYALPHPMKIAIGGNHDV